MSACCAVPRCRHVLLHGMHVSVSGGICHDRHNTTWNQPNMASVIANLHANPELVDCDYIALSFSNWHGRHDKKVRSASHMVKDSRVPPYFTMRTLPMHRMGPDGYRYSFVGQGSRALAYRLLVPDIAQMEFFLGGLVHGDSSSSSWVSSCLLVLVALRGLQALVQDVRGLFSSTPVLPPPPAPAPVAEPPVSAPEPAVRAPEPPVSGPMQAPPVVRHYVRQNKFPDEIWLSSAGASYHLKGDCTHIRTRTKVTTRKLCTVCQEHNQHSTQD